MQNLLFIDFLYSSTFSGFMCLSWVLNTDTKKKTDRNDSSVFWSLWRSRKCTIVVDDKVSNVL